MSEAQKRTNDPAGLRRRVLDAAAASFQAAGYAGTSTHDLVGMAGVTPGALHHHFPSKKALGLAVIKERVAPEIAETWLAVRSAKSAATGIAQVFATVISSLDRNKAVTGCPLGNLALELSLSDPDLRAAMAQEYETWRKLIANRIRSDRQKGLASYAPDPDAFATNVVALFSGALTIAKAEQTTAALRSSFALLRTIMEEEVEGTVRRGSGRAIPRKRLQ
jgi:AcrR family transcriptional regulator